MTSLQGPTSLYVRQEPTFFTEKQYNPSFAMAYIYKHSPIYAQCIQTAGLENWFDSAEFDSTCFIPCKEYSDLYLNQFIDWVDIRTARQIVYASTIQNRVTSATLQESEYIPTRDNYQDIQVQHDNCGHLWVNNTRIIQKDILLENGVIHIINGMFTPTSD